MPKQKPRPVPVPSRQAMSLHLQKLNAEPIDRFRLLVECDDEPHQKRLYEQLTRLGLQCRPLLL